MQQSSNHDTDASAASLRNEIAALKRERIIEAAVDLFYRIGYEQATLDAVAEQLGVTKPFIYAHFKSKTDLLAEICSRGIASSLNAIDNARLAASPVEKLEKLAHGFATAALQSQRHIAIFNREEKNLSSKDLTRISAMRRDFDAKLVALLREGLASGDFELDDPELAALAIGGMVSWTYVWFRSNGRLSSEEVARGLANLVLSMAGVRVARRGQTRRSGKFMKTDDRSR